MHTLSPTTCIAFPIASIAYQNCTFTTKDEPTLAHYNHPESIVYLSVYSWYCTFYGFGQICNDIYSSL